MIEPIEDTYRLAEQLSREFKNKAVRVYKVIGKSIRYVRFDDTPRNQIDGDDVLLLRSYRNGEVTNG